MDYILNELDRLKLLNVNCLKLGLIGLPDGDKLSLHSIQQDINARLNQNNLTDEEITIFIKILLTDCQYEIVKELEKLNHDDEVDKKRIAAVVLSLILKNCDNDFVHDLIDIATFWSKWNEWACIKITDYQGVDNHLTPTQYYTKENFDYVFLQSKKWCDYILKGSSSNF